MVIESKKNSAQSKQKLDLMLLEMDQIDQTLERRQKILTQMQDAELEHDRISSMQIDEYVAEEEPEDDRITGYIRGIEEFQKV